MFGVYQLLMNIFTILIFRTDCDPKSRSHLLQVLIGARFVYMRVFNLYVRWTTHVCLLTQIFCVYSMYNSSLILITHYCNDIIIGPFLNSDYGGSVTIGEDLPERGIHSGSNIGVHSFLTRKRCLFKERYILSKLVCICICEQHFSCLE